MGLMVRDRGFYKNLAAIALPIALQNAIGFGVQMMDTIMVGSLGDTALSAANLAGQPYFIFMVFNFGLASGGSVLIAQYWGKGNTDVVRRVIGMSIRYIAITAVLFSAVCFCIPTQIMSLFSHEAEVISLGAGYLRVASVAYFFNGVAGCYLMSLRAVENVNLSTIVYAVSFFVNVFFNYCFIFGKFGMPALGVVGAAVGTVIARFTEFLFVVVYLSFFEKKIQFKLKHIFRRERQLVPDYLRHSLPVVGSELVWSLGSVTQAAIIGRIGSTFVAANSIASVVQQFAMVFMFGLGNAAAVTMGKTVGEGRTEDAKKQGKTLVVLALGIGLAACAVILLLRRPIADIYRVSDEVKALAVDIMGVMACIMALTALELVSISGILRGGGDTKFAFAVDCGCTWLIGVPMGLLAGFVWKLPVIWVYVCLRSDMPVRVSICLARIFGEKYIKNVTREL